MSEHWAAPWVRLRLRKMLTEKWQIYEHGAQKGEHGSVIKLPCCNLWQWSVEMIVFLCCVLLSLAFFSLTEQMHSLNQCICQDQTGHDLHSTTWSFLGSKSIFFWITRGSTAIVCWAVTAAKMSECRAALRLNVLLSLCRRLLQSYCRPLSVHLLDELVTSPIPDRCTIHDNTHRHCCITSHHVTQNVPIKETKVTKLLLFSSVDATLWRILWLTSARSNMHVLNRKQ